MDVELIDKWMTKFHQEILANREKLNSLDTPIGDGDHGSNMVRGMNAVVESLKKESANDVRSMLMTIAKSLLSKVGGSAGPLYGSAFMAMAKEMSGSGDFGQAVKAGSQGIMTRGKSTTGEKTMVDVWESVADHFINDDLTSAVIDEAVQSTEPMKATKGRASYVGERSIGHIDPGAYSSGLLFKSLLEAKGE